MGAESFIYETSNNRLQRLIALSILVLLLAAGLIIVIANIRASEPNPDAPHWYSRFVPDLVHNITPIKLFYICMLGGMIFFPLPTELAFYFSIIQGNSPVLCVLAAVGGFFIGAAVNYFVGLKLSKQIRYLLSTKAFYKVRRQANRWGAYALVLFNIIPAPNDLLGVGLGTIRYNKQRFFILSVLGTTIKFTIIALAAHAVKGIF